MSRLRIMISCGVLLLVAACGKSAEMPQNEPSTPVQVTLLAPKQAPSPCTGVTQAVLTVSAVDINPQIVVGPIPAASGQTVEFKAIRLPI